MKQYTCIDGLVQEGRNSIANALEFRLSCINPLILLSQSQTFCWSFIRNGRIDVKWNVMQWMNAGPIVWPLTITITWTLDFQGQILKKLYLMMGELIDMEQNGCESIGCWTHYVTLNTHELPSFEIIVSQEWEGQLTWKERDVINQSIKSSFVKGAGAHPQNALAGGAAMLWGRLPLDRVGSCRLFFTDDLHDNLSWVPASDKPHTFKSCFTHSSQVFFGRPGPFLPGTGLDLTLFISPLERMTCPNHLSRRSRTRMARSHIPSLACSSSIDGSSDGLTPQIQQIIARSLRHSWWRAAEVMGQVSVPCNIELRTLELNRRPLRSKGTGLDVS